MITCIIIILFGTFKRGTEDWIINNTFYDSLLLHKNKTNGKYWYIDFGNF